MTAKASPARSDLLASLPVMRRDRVYHVGDLDAQAARRSISYEGTGLSVSQHPSAWRQIARLAGDVWTLKRRGERGAFVDFYRLGARHKSALTEAAIAAGLVEPCRIYVVNGTDEEGESCRFVFGPDERERAYEEAASLDEPGDEAAITEEDGFIALPTMLDIWASHFGIAKIPACLALEFAWTVVVERVGHYEGIWWNEHLDVPRLGAPRGVIFQSRLAGWDRTKSPARSRLTD